MKETFIIRTEWMESILELDLKDQAIIFQNLFFFHSGEETKINLNNLGVKLIWKLIEPCLKRNVSSYDKRIEVSKENGKKGGRPESELDLISLTGEKIPRIVLPEDHFLYVFKRKSTGEYKVGETQDLYKRRLSIKIPTADLQIIHFVKIDKSKSLDIEKLVKINFSKNHISGDWYNFKEDEIHNLIKFFNTQINQNKPKKSNETLFDSDSDSDYEPVIELVSDNEFVFEDVELKIQRIKNAEIWLNGVSKMLQISFEEIKQKIEVFLQELKLKDDLRKDDKEIKSHFINWLKIQLEKEKNSVKKEKPTYDEAMKKLIYGG